MLDQKRLVENAQKAENLKQEELAKQQEFSSEEIKNNDCNTSSGIEYSKDRDPAWFDPKAKEQCETLTNPHDELMEAPQQSAKPVSDHLAVTFKDIPSESVKKPSATAKDVELFLSKALNSNDDDSEGLINDFGYLLICEDSILIKEAANKIRAKFKKFFANT